jgi:hypothetical protein
MRSMTQKKLDRCLKAETLKVIANVSPTVKEVVWQSGFREYVTIERKEK